MRTAMPPGQWQPHSRPRANDPSGLRQESRALGATISRMRHRCRLRGNRMGRIRLFRLSFQNGCSQNSRFPTAGQGEQRLWERHCGSHGQLFRPR